MSAVEVLCFRKARQSAPTDGRDANGAIVAASKIALTSKQNSDANGMFYQWGHKDPFTFATSSLQWGGNSQYGKHPVKIYTIDGVLIYQESNGTGNNDKQPTGGVIFSSTPATSMMEVIKNPVKLYGNYVVVNQDGHTKSLWDYYWTAYSRGTDGNVNTQIWHNSYLDKYISQRSKSIYDPCPYGFRVPPNGVYNQFSSTPGWILWSYVGGVSWKLTNISTWIKGLGYRQNFFLNIGERGIYSTSTSSQIAEQYSFYAYYANSTITNRNTWVKSIGNSVRCIEKSCVVM